MTLEARYNARLLLSLLGLRGVGSARVRSIIDWLISRRLPLDDELPTTLSQTRLLTAEHGVEFQNQLPKAEKQLSQLYDSGVDVVTIVDREYPREMLARLNASAPPILFYKGPLGLLESPTVGFCGSRKASDRGLSVAEDVASQLATDGVVTISGYAAGVDTAVHSATVEKDGSTIVVLAEGIKHFRVKRVLKKRWDEDRILVLSEFLPGLPWNSRQAMQRNETICALSDAVVLIEAGATGGSIAAGRSALRMGVPLFAPLYDGMPESAEGNRLVLAEGAIPLGRDRATGHANTQRILQVIRRSRRREGGVRQLSLLDQANMPKERRPAALAREP